MLDRNVVLLGAGAAAVGLLALYRYRDSLNPASQNNLVNQAASGAVVALTGGAAAGGEDSLGGVLARAREYLSGDDAAIKAMLSGSPAPSATGVADLSSAGYVGYVEPAKATPPDPLADFASDYFYFAP